jgi:hypothetical protein
MNDTYSEFSTDTTLQNDGPFRLRLVCRIVGVDCYVGVPNSFVEK